MNKLDQLSSLVQVVQIVRLANQTKSITSSNSLTG